MFDRWNLIIQGAHVRLITSPVYGFDADRPLRVGSTGYVSRVERVRGITEIEVAWHEGDDDYSLFVLRDDDQWNPLSTLEPIDWCPCRHDYRICTLRFPPDATEEEIETYLNSCSDAVELTMPPDPSQEVIDYFNAWRKRGEK